MMRVAPAASAAASNWPVPKVLARSGSSSSCASSSMPEASAISMTAVRPSGSSPHSACTIAPSGPATDRLRRSPPAASMASSVPLPPSATGASTRLASRPDCSRPRAMASAACCAVRLFLKAPGATMMRMLMLMVAPLPSPQYAKSRQPRVYC